MSLNADITMAAFPMV